MAANPAVIPSQLPDRPSSDFLTEISIERLPGENRGSRFFSPLPLPHHIAKLLPAGAKFSGSAARRQKTNFGVRPRASIGSWPGGGWGWEAIGLQLEQRLAA